MSAEENRVSKRSPKFARFARIRTNASTLQIRAGLDDLSNESAVDLNRL